MIVGGRSVEVVVKMMEKMVAKMGCFGGRKKKKMVVKLGYGYCCWNGGGDKDHGGVSGDGGLETEPRGLVCCCCRWPLAGRRRKKEIMKEREKEGGVYIKRKLGLLQDCHTIH